MRLFFRLLALIIAVSCVKVNFCYGQDNTSGNNIHDERRTRDERRAVDERAAFDERHSIDQRNAVNHEVYIRDIYQRFGEYVDDIYVVSFRQESYVNAHILIENQEFDIGKIFGDIAIGTGVIIVTAVLMPALLPALSPRLVVIVTQFPKAGTLVRAGLANAAIGAGMNSIVSYAKSGGDLEATMNGALVGAGEGFKWGVITVAGANLASVAVRYHNKIVIPTRNSHLAGTVHPNTKVPFARELVVTARRQFGEAVLPQFKSKFSFPMIQLPEELVLASSAQHNAYCTNFLKNYIEKNPNFANNFTRKQLAEIRAPSSNAIEGLLWHHTGTRGQMQLVDRRDHILTGHTGGYDIWGQGGMSK